jgi:hypothetical protein
VLVVGKNFAITKEIEQHSGVLRIKVGDDRDSDMAFLQDLVVNGIPGVSKVDEQSNLISGAESSAAAAAIAAAAGPSSLDKEKDTHKRSAFDRVHKHHCYRLPAVARRTPRTSHKGICRLKRHTYVVCMHKDETAKQVAGPNDNQPGCESEWKKKNEWGCCSLVRM